MTLQQKINEILYPNKADMLVFGCKIKIGDKIFTLNDCLEFYNLETGKLHIAGKRYYLQGAEIIGKPIMLDDLLLAIYKIDIFIELINNGDYVSIRTGANSFVKWQLGKSLTEQSQDTIDKINAIFN